MVPSPSCSGLTLDAPSLGLAVPSTPGEQTPAQALSSSEMQWEQPGEDPGEDPLAAGLRIDLPTTAEDLSPAASPAAGQDAFPAAPAPAGGSAPLAMHPSREIARTTSALIRSPKVTRLPADGTPAAAGDRLLQHSSTAPTTRMGPSAAPSIAMAGPDTPAASNGAGGTAGRAAAPSGRVGGVGEMSGRTASLTGPVRTGTMQHPLFGHPKYQALQVASGAEAAGNLGAGAFGVVQLARNLQTGEQVAIKFIELARLSNEHQRRYILSEVLNHRMLQHPHIVKFHEVFLTRHHIAIVMDYANAGTLLSYVRSMGGRINETAARWFFQQLIMGIDFCHRKGVVNRDIKLENTLVHVPTGIPLPLVQICDFGYSKGYWLSLPKSTVGTRAYMAPEVMRMHGEYDARLADIWSCGVVLYAMLYGRLPFGAKGCCADVGDIPSLPWDVPGVQVSPECCDLLQSMFQEPGQRVAMAGVVTHPWFCHDLPAGALHETELYLARGVDASLQAEEDICSLLRVSMPPRILIQRNSAESQ